MKKFKVGSVYSGGGLGSSGARSAGGHEIFAVDLNKTAEKVFRQNFPNVPFFRQNAMKVTVDLLRKLGVKEEDILDLSLLLLSPPCTGISRRNLYRHPFLPVNMLLLDCPRLVQEFKPKVAIIENVEGLTDDCMSPLLTLFISKCMALTDYNFDYKILNALDYGVPQSRKRFIGMLVRKDIGTPVFPEPTTKDYGALNLCAQFPNVLGYDTGGSRKKIILPNGEIIGLSGKLVSSDRPMGTFTATACEAFLDSLVGFRKPYRHERIQLCSLEEMNFEGITDNELGFVSGNGIMPRFMQAICETLAKAYF